VGSRALRNPRRAVAETLLGDARSHRSQVPVVVPGEQFGDCGFSVVPCPRPRVTVSSAIETLCIVNICWAAGQPSEPVRVS
jgi:hypothetical protein